MKAIIIIIVVLVLVTVGYFVFRGNQENANTNIPGTTNINTETGSTTVKEFTVSGTEYSFSPSSISVKAGEKVKITFKNAGSVIHNLIVEGLEAGSETISGGQTDSFEFTAPTSGTYSFYCSVGNHRSLGMEGRLGVE